MFKIIGLNPQLEQQCCNNTD